MSVGTFTTQTDWIYVLQFGEIKVFGYTLSRFYVSFDNHCMRKCFRSKFLFWRNFFGDMCHKTTRLPIWNFKLALSVSTFPFIKVFNLKRTSINSFFMLETSERCYGGKGSNVLVLNRKVTHTIYNFIYDWKFKHSEQSCANIV